MGPYTPYIVLAVVIIAIIFLSKPIGNMIEKHFKDEWNNAVDEFADGLKIKDE